MKRNTGRISYRFAYIRISMLSGVLINKIVRESKTHQRFFNMTDLLIDDISSSYKLYH